MSTILDSLKKSSDQRGDNEKSSIDNFNFSNDRKPRKSNAFLFVLILLALTAAIMYFGYDYLYDDEETTQATTDQLEINKDTTIASDSKEQITDKPPIAKVESRRSKPDNQSVKQKIKDIKQKKQEQRTLASQNEQKKEMDSPTVSEIKRQALDMKVEEPLLKLTMPNDQKKPEISALIKPEQIKEPQQKPEEPKPQVHKQNYQYVYQLPFAIRKDIPKMTLNIHVYDENPENRIVVINGTRFMINDMIDEQVLVKDIVQEGVLLDFNNHEFLVPKL